MTLVEVVAALALLVIAASSLLLAHARATRQIAWSAERVRVSDALNELVIGWRLRHEDWSRPAEGVFEELPAWRWTRSAVPYDQVNGDSLLQVRLDVVHDGLDGTTELRQVVIWLVPVAETK